MDDKESCSWDKFQSIEVEKLGDYGIPGHRFQGMACDGTCLYLASHESDSGATTITKVRASDGSIARRAEIPLTGHFNSLMHLGGWLYASCAGDGGDYGSMACIKCSDLSYRTYRLPYDMWSIAVADSGSGMHLAGLIADSHEWALFDREDPDAWALSPFRRFKGYDGSGIAQGCDADADHIYHLYAYDDGDYNATNVIACMEWDGHVRRVLSVRGAEGVELEDVCVPGDGDVYVDGIDGSVWRGRIANILKPEFKTGVRTPWSGPCVQNVYREGNGTERLASSSPRVVESFKCSPFVYFSTLSDVRGEARVNGYGFPVSYDAASGDLSCTGSYMKGYKTVQFSLVWKMTGDSRQYGWALDPDSWICDQAAERSHYGAAGIAKSGLMPRGLRVGCLTGLFSLKPTARIDM